MKRSNSETTYCSEAEKTLLHSNKINAECNLRRSKRLTQKPESLREKISWENIRFSKDKVRLRDKEFQQTQDSVSSSQLLAEEIDDCSFKGNVQLNCPQISKEMNKNLLLSIDLIAELETPTFSLELPQNQIEDPSNKVGSRDSNSPMDLRTHLRSLRTINNENTLTLGIYSKECKFGQGTKRKGNNSNEKEKFRKIDGGLEVSQKNYINDVSSITKINDKVKLINQMPFSTENKVELTRNIKPTKRKLPNSRLIEDQPCQKKRKEVVTTRNLGLMQKTNKRKKENLTEELDLKSYNFDEEQHKCTNINTNIPKEEYAIKNRLNKKKTTQDEISLNTTIPHLSTTRELTPYKVDLTNFNGKNSDSVPSTPKKCTLTSLNNSTLESQDDKISLVQINAKQSQQNTELNLMQNTSKKSTSSNMCKTSKINKGQNNKRTVKSRKNLKSKPIEGGLMDTFSTKDENIIYGQIPKISTIPLLPATTNSLLPKVYPPHFTGQLPAPIPEPMPLKKFKNTTNLNETQLILNCDRELNYWLTPELTQSFDEEALSSSTPSLSDSLKGIFETDSFREVLHIEKIVYRLEDRHVKALAMVLNIGIEIIHKILKHIVSLDENILKTVNDMMKTMPPPIDTFEIKDSPERVEPSGMVISPISSSSVELIESPKVAQSRVFQSQRRTT